jgi:hypothetical protein
MHPDPPKSLSADRISWKDHWTLVIVVNLIFLGLEFMVYRALAP